MRYLNCIVLALMVACSTEKKESASDVAVISETLAPEAFKAKLEAEPDGVLIDVRTPEEVSQGIIKGAKHIDFKGAEFEQQLASLDKDKTYFVYCGSGGRSGKTADLLKDKGFKKVYDLEGGIGAWKEKGLELTPP
jgi:phage shock protein E